MPIYSLNPHLKTWDNQKSMNYKKEKKKPWILLLNHISCKTEPTETNHHLMKGWGEGENTKIQIKNYKREAIKVFLF